MEKCLLLLLAALTVQIFGQENVVVDTSVGRIQGHTVNRDGFTTNLFLGIPFAKPPIGEFRFAAPEPYGNFEETFVASKFGNVCPQPTEPLKLLLETDVMSEDCLSLNIFVPENPSDNARSVMIFIHGGGYAIGASTTYDGDVLANVGDVIVVTINYRLGALGFMNGNYDGVAGNMGLKDQQLAIQWVKNNIEYFGGDPQSLTIFGESAGGGSVSCQTVSPQNKGLFQRAIAHSGTILAPWSFDYKPLKGYNNLVNQLNCTNESKEEELRCLQTVPWSDLLMSFQLGLYFTPSADGEFITESPLEFIKNVDSGIRTPSIETYESIDYISGVNSQEGLLLANMAAMASPNTSLDNGIDSNMHRASLEMVLYSDSSKLMSEMIIRLYKISVIPFTEKQLLEHFVQFGGDWYFVIGHEEMLRLRSKLSRQSKTYSYYLDQKATIKIPAFGTFPDWLVQGSNHGEDLVYAFGFATTDRKIGFGLPIEGESTEGDKQLSMEMMRLWSNFAKTGEPDSSIWEEHTASGSTFRFSYSKPMGMIPHVIDADLKEQLLRIALSHFTVESRWKPEAKESDGTPEVSKVKDEL